MDVQEYIAERSAIVDTVQIADAPVGSFEYVNTYSSLGSSGRHVIAVFYANELMREELYDIAPNGKEYRVGTVYHGEDWRTWPIAR